MYSAGTVTRGAQEALLCGYPAGRDTSAMRNRRDIRLTCLTDAATKHEKIGTLWYHGGEASFDSQGNYWKKHQMTEIHAIDSYSETLDVQGWGLVDRQFFKASYDKYLTYKQKTQNRMHLLTLLSSSNHVPWNLSSDEINQYGPYNSTHPSQKTAGYSLDSSLEFLEKLKKSEFWDDSIVIFIGDHGHVYPSYSFSKSKDHRHTNVAMTISGGITEQAQRTFHGVIDTDSFKTQTDVSITIGHILGLNKFKAVGEDLFSNRSKSIFSDTGNTVFFPEFDFKILKSKLLVGDIPEDLQKNKDLINSMNFYRLFWNRVLGDKKDRLLEKLTRSSTDENTYR